MSNLKVSVSIGEDAVGGLSIDQDNIASCDDAYNSSINQEGKPFINGNGNTFATPQGFDIKPESECGDTSTVKFVSHVFFLFSCV